MTGQGVLGIVCITIFRPERPIEIPDIMHYYPVILSGGAGSRLWPASREFYPKPLLPMFGERTLLQDTAIRLDGIESVQAPLFVCNEEHRFLVAEQVRALGKDTEAILLEPEGRNTAPAIALACMALEPDEIVLVTPSDHLVKDRKAYEEAVRTAERLAEDGYLVTFGIEPHYPETGFGYIEFRVPGSEFRDKGYDVAKFHEKPDLKTAQIYLQKNSEPRTPNSEHYLWNSGIFCFKAGVYLKELKKHAPEIYEACEKAYTNAKSEPRTLNSEPNLIRIGYEDMASIPEESIDYAVMERSDIVKVVPCDIGWSDLGSFDALYEELPKDENGNTLNDNHVSLESKNNLVIGSERTIATVDVEDLIIVDTADALLISRKGRSQNVKKIVNELKQKGSDLPTVHLTAHRPWGTYTVLEDTPGYKIKRIVVKPGKRLSLQKHFHRSEHWIVVSGTATVTVGDETKLIRPNESTYIKMGEVHRLANEGKIPVVLIEAQVGEYTGEDDIVRLDDDFSRN